MLRPSEIEDEYERLLKAKDKPIIENSSVQCWLKWQKATHDLLLAEGLLKISTDIKLKESLEYIENVTFFDWAIISSYYSIFHATEALLGMKRVRIEGRMHHATLVSFAKHFIINNELAAELFLIYENSEEKAKDLLEIFEEEKGKRGDFQYHKLSKNNLGPATDSIHNAKVFLKAVREVLEKNNII